LNDAKKEQGGFLWSGRKRKEEEESGAFGLTTPAGLMVPVVGT
jgi:hypothetical protein